MHARKPVHVFLSRKAWLAIAISCALLAYWVWMRWFIPKQTEADVFALLQAKEYTPNPGFSGLYRPGNIIQVAEQGTSGEDHQLVVPVVFAWGSDCFPDQVPKTQEFTLSQGTGSLGGSLSVNRESTARLLPSLNLHSEMVADYSVKLENPHLLVFAKGDLSGDFSRPCVAKLKAAIRSGDKVEWFKVVLAAVVADAVTLEIRWKDNSSVDARNRVTENAKDAIGSKPSFDASASANSGMNIALTNSSEKDTTMAAKGLVIIGYQARSIQPSSGE